MLVCDGCGKKYRIGEVNDITKLEVSEVFDDFGHVLFSAELCDDCRKALAENLEKKYFWKKGRVK